MSLVLSGLCCKSVWPVPKLANAAVRPGFLADASNLMEG